MEYREFGRTGMRLSVIGTGGLLAHYWEGESGHPPPEEKRRIYLRAAESGINLFDMGYGDEVHIPEELKGNTDEHYFSLKVGAPTAADLEGIVDKHLVNLRRDAIDILRVHYYAYMKDAQLRKRITDLKQMGKARSLCLIRHFEADQDAYVTRGPEKGADADLVIYNYVCRGQAPGIRAASKAGKGVLVMKALGGQYLSWQHKTGTDWTKATEETLVQLSPLGESMRSELSLVYSFTTGPWNELAEAEEKISPTGQAVSWVLENQGVSSALVAVASVAELEAVLEGI
jgi:aryl-alcohol dehydrogenase-like predicted oxidoreductase